MAVVEITESAAKRVNTLKERLGNPDLKLRVSVSGGGCAGFQYGFDFAEAANADDEVVEQHGVTVLVDAMSLLYVIGCTLDYKEGIVGSAFRIENPNASSSCGCGSSFSI